jgi:hypothetical protein
MGRIATKARGVVLTFLCMWRCSFVLEVWFAPQRTCANFLTQFQFQWPNISHGGAFDGKSNIAVDLPKDIFIGQNGVQSVQPFAKERILHSFLTHLAGRADSFAHDPEFRDPADPCQCKGAITGMIETLSASCRSFFAGAEQWVLNNSIYMLRQVACAIRHSPLPWPMPWKGPLCALATHLASPIPLGSTQQP